MKGEQLEKDSRELFSRRDYYEVKSHGFNFILEPGEVDKMINHN